MPRFFAPKENIRGNLIYIEDKEARHITNVMRLKENDKIIVFDGTGKEYMGFIKQTKPKSLIVEIVSVRSPKEDTLPKITLAQAMPKKEKMDYIVEKVTELGAHTVIPVESERTIVRVAGEKAINKVCRWRKKAMEAAKQCGRTDVPEVKNIRRFSDVVNEISNFDLALMACIAGETIGIKEAISDFESGSIIIFIGPEGDFTPGEIEMARDARCKFISLGSRILKSDTACFYVLSVLNHEFSRL